MASGIFRKKEADTIEDQIAQIRDDIAALAKIAARDASSGASRVRDKADAVRGRLQDKADDLKGHAQSDIQSLISTGEDIIADISERYHNSGKEVRRTVREHPVATLGTALVAGFILAALLRR